MADIQGSIVRLNDLPTGAKVITWGHRSGAEAHQRCPRAYYLNYEYLSRGIQSYPTPIHFKIGSAVHLGLAAMLLEEGIDSAVKQALDYLFNSRAFGKLQPDQQVEQEVLVHGLLYAFWVWAMPSMRSNYEVICVETEAVEYVELPRIDFRCSLPLADHYGNYCFLEQGHEGQCQFVSRDYLAIQSRPDAILRNRRTGEVSGWSWKTIDDPTDLRRSQFHNDLQGFMEMHYGERILEKMAGAPVTLEELRNVVAFLSRDLPANDVVHVIGKLREELGQLEDRARSARNIPTTIDSIQTVFLVKGKRILLDAVEMPWINSAPVSPEDDEYGGYAPDKVYKQMSHLCYRYRNPNCEAGAVELYKSGPNKGKPKPIDPHDPNLMDESWAKSFYKLGNESYSRLGNHWLGSPIQPDQVRGWIDRLAGGCVYPSTLNDERNPHPLDKLIRFETPLYRDSLKAAGHVKQVKERYVQIAQAVQTMKEEGCDNLTALDSLFPQHLINCKTPYKCSYFNFCHTPAEAQLDFQSVPEGFELRFPHYQSEVEERGIKEDESTDK